VTHTTRTIKSFTNLRIILENLTITLTKPRFFQYLAIIRKVWTYLHRTVLKICQSERLTSSRNWRTFWESKITRNLPTRLIRPIALAPIFLVQIFAAPLTRKIKISLPPRPKISKSKIMKTRPKEMATTRAKIKITGWPAVRLCLQTIL
jgi:hypothetical protein